MSVAAGRVKPRTKDSLPLEGSWEYIRDWISRGWQRWVGYLDEKGLPSPSQMVPSFQARHGGWPTAPKWLEFSASTLCFLGLLCHWSFRLSAAPAWVCGQVLRRLLAKAVPPTSLVWWWCSARQCCIAHPWQRARGSD